MKLAVASSSRAVAAPVCKRSTAAGVPVAGLGRALPPRRAPRSKPSNQAPWPSSTPTTTSTAFPPTRALPASASSLGLPALALCCACAPGPLLFALGAAAAALADAAVTVVATVAAAATAARVSMLSSVSISFFFFVAIFAGFIGFTLARKTTATRPTSSRLSESRKLRDALAEHSETLAGIERGIAILYGHVDNVSNAQLETARRAAILRADVDAALDALLGPGAAEELRAAGAGAAAASRKARLDAAESASRLARVTGCYAGVLCSALLFGGVAKVVARGRNESVGTTTETLMLPAPKATDKTRAVPSSYEPSPTSQASSSSPPSSHYEPESFASAQERWAAASAAAAFGHDGASSTSMPSSSLSFSSLRRSSSKANLEGEEEVTTEAESSTNATNSSLAAAFAFLGVLPVFGPFLRRGGRQK